MKHLKSIFNNFFTKKKEDNEASVAKIAECINKLGLAQIEPEDYQILMETMDKNKDGRICFTDFLSQIPLFDSEKVLGMKKKTGTDGAKQKQGETILLEKGQFEKIVKDYKEKQSI